MKLFLRLVRFLCYMALVVLIGGFVSLFLLPAIGVCSTVSMSSISCSTPFYKSIAELGVTVVILTAFTGIPLLLAGAGLIFLLYDVFLWNHARKVREQLSENPDDSVKQGKPSFLLFLLKFFGVVLVLVLIAGVVVNV